MSTVKKLFIVKLCIQLALLQSLFYPASSYALDAATQNMNRAMSGIMQSAFAARGYVPSDPRTYSTLAAVSRTVGSSAVGGAVAITVGAITAPGWVSIAAAITLGAVITYAVNLGLDSLTKWLFNQNGTVDQAGSEVVGSANCVMAPGSVWFQAGAVTATSPFVAKTFYGCDGMAVARQAYAFSIAGKPNAVQMPTCTVEFSGLYVLCGAVHANGYSTPVPATCPPNNYYEGGVCHPYTFVESSVPAATGVALPTAVNNIPATDLDKPVNPALLAAMANKTWQQAAAQPGYSGIPYPASNPVTTAEAQTWTNANPTFAPTVRDFVSPNPVTTANPQPWALPSDPTAATTSPTTAANPNAINPASANPLSNLGEDPVTPSPTLEATPTAPMILDPILNMLPGHRGFIATAHTGDCPRPTINLYGTHVMDAHCTLIDANKGLIQTAMMFAWVVIALLIVLSA